MSDQLSHDLALLIFKLFDQSGMNQKMEDRTFKIFVGPRHANAAGTTQHLRADQTLGISIAVKFDRAGAISARREPSEDVRYIVSLATSAGGQVPLTSHLRRLKRWDINYRRVVAGNGRANRNTFLASARIALRLMLPDCRSIPQHTVNGRMVPFWRCAKRRNALSVEMVGNTIAAKPANAELKDLLNDLSSVRQENEGTAIF